MSTYIKKKEELRQKERELAHLKQKVEKGEVTGNGVPHLIETLNTEIKTLKTQLGIDKLS